MLDLAQTLQNAVVCHRRWRAVFVETAQGGEDEKNGACGSFLGGHRQHDRHGGMCQAYFLRQWIWAIHAWEAHKQYAELFQMDRSQYQVFLTFENGWWKADVRQMKEMGVNITELCERYCRGSSIKVPFPLLIDYDLLYGVDHLWFASVRSRLLPLCWRLILTGMYWTAKLILLHHLQKSW